MAHATSDSFASDRGTASFNVLEPGRAVRGKAAYELRHIPWADNNQLSAAGAVSEEREFTVYCPSSGELDNIRTCLGRSGTLSYTEGSQSAFLAEYDASEYFASAEQIVKLLFVVLS